MGQIKDIEYIDINEIIKYENNSKKHPKKQIETLKKSIEEFGFLTPCLIDEKNNLITGHGRLEASTQLGLKKIPCVRVDGLTEEQRKAYVIADNKLTELGGWDKEILINEINDLNLNDFEIDAIGFSTIDYEKMYDDIFERSYGDEKQRTLKQVKLLDYDKERKYGKYDIPTLKKCDIVPKDMIGFNYVLTTKKQEDFNNGVHFFIDDYQFERIWNNPKKYIDKLKKFKCVCTPDFSPYSDMPTAMKIWNVYRNRMIGQIMQDEGINVIPTITWSDESTFEYVIDGIERGGTVAISTVSISKKKEDEIFRNLFFKGLNLVVERIQPKTIILYGSKDLDIDIKGVEIVRIKPKSFNRKG